MKGYIVETKSDQYSNLKFVLIILGLLYCLYYFSSRMEWHFIDNVDLIIHEAGHVVFMLFGETLYIAGGSIFQVLIPGLFAGYFFIKQAFYSTALMLYWAGLSLINVAVYAGDAVKMRLPLLTGDTDTHDWNQLLFKFGLLHYTELISNIILSAGVIVILVGFIFAFVNWNNLRTEKLKESL